MVGEDRTAGDGQVRRDPRAADPEAAAREIAEAEGIPFEAALADVLASIEKRAAAARRIRAIREEGTAKIAMKRAEAEAGEDAGQEVEEVAAGAPPERLA